MKAMLFLLALMLALPANAQTEGVVVRSTFKPDSGVVIGQPVRLLVDVLFPEEMPRPPRVAVPEMPGAQLVRYETQATGINERIDGKSYTGQRFEFAIYPRRGGTLDVPAPSATVLNAAEDVVGTVQGKPAVLQVTVPPGVDASRPLVATEKLTLDEQWAPTPSGSFKAGDDIVRTIVRTAADVPGMAMLDLDFEAPSGVRVYVEPPLVEDRVARGDLTGRRTDRATYVFEAAGSFVLPDFAQPWWDLAANRLRRAEARGATIAIAAAPVVRNRAATIEAWIFLAATALGLAVFALWAGPRVAERWPRHRAVWLASEGKAFADLRAASRTGDARAIYLAFATWRRRLARPADVAALAEEIELALFAGKPWSVTQGIAFTERAGRQRQEHSSPLDTGLPPLNPTGKDSAAAAGRLWRVVRVTVRNSWRTRRTRRGGDKWPKH